MEKRSHEPEGDDLMKRHVARCLPFILASLFPGISLLAESGRLLRPLAAAPSGSRAYVGGPIEEQATASSGYPGSQPPSVNSAEADQGDKAKDDKKKWFWNKIDSASGFPYWFKVAVHNEPQPNSFGRTKLCGETQQNAIAEEFKNSQPKYFRWGTTNQVDINTYNSGARHFANERLFNTCVAYDPNHPNPPTSAEPSPISTPSKVGTQSINPGSTNQSSAEPPHTSATTATAAAALPSTNPAIGISSGLSPTVPNTEAKVVHDEPVTIRVWLGHDLYKLNYHGKTYYVRPAEGALKYKGIDGKDRYNSYISMPNNPVGFGHKYRFSVSMDTKDVTMETINSIYADGTGKANIDQ
jgi:hypothetical protein